MFKKLKNKLNFATIIFGLGALIAIFYFIASFFTITDNAFVVKVISPVSSKVNGTVTAVYVKNGQHVLKGQKLFKIDDESYLLSFQSAKAQYLQGKTGIEALEKRISMTEYSKKAAEDNLKLLQYKYQQKSQVSVKNAVPFMELHELTYQISAQQNSIHALSQQIQAQKIELEQAKTALGSLKAAYQQAQLDLEHTIVKAQSDGVVNNIFLGIGKAVHTGQSVFSLVDDGPTYIQANFKETDLAGVKSGDSVYIYPRAYFGKKVFHGVVESQPLAIDRQKNNPVNSTQIIFSENKWLLLPQRMPVIIKVLDTDQDYPLQSGMSAYVYIHA
ncbi:HlyD family secretion protein [Facilibium subflavum]|uniref:HlyD family secretion protein n=1 Tax=Facilibium subflavum TaxID=2219058 RepID=UPI000E64CA5F|nr:HlyD family secretion protein [Facilibium subflavum]